MNVRCPNCSAVFPVTAPPAAEPQQVECPLCLLRFQPSNETTVSLPEMPAQLRGTAAPSPDDEFESFGAPAHTGIRAFGQSLGTVSNPRPFVTGDIRTTTFPPAAPPLAPTPSRPADEPTFAPGVPPFGKPASSFSDDNIDFEALLGDTLAPVAPTNVDNSPFGRIAAPRTGNTEVVRDPFGPSGNTQMPIAQPFGAPKPPQGISIFDTPTSHPLSATSDPILFDPLVDLGEPPIPPLSSLDSLDPHDDLPGFADHHAETAPVQSVPADGHDDDGFAGFAGLDVAMGARRTARENDSGMVGVRADQQTAAVRRRGPDRKAAAAPGVKQYIQRVATFLVLTAAAVVLAGAAFEAAGYGWFGRRLWTKSDEGAKRAVDSARRAAAALAPPTPLWDTSAGYESEIARLESLATLNPKDPAIAQELIDRYLDLYERFPERFLALPDAKAKLETRLSKMKAPQRFAVLKKIGFGSLPEPAEIEPLASGSPDDQGIALRESFMVLLRSVRADVLSRPGMAGDGESDGVRLAFSSNAQLTELRTKAAAITAAAKNQRNAFKFKMLEAMLADEAGDAKAVLALLQDVNSVTEVNAEARILSASANVDLGNLDAASALLREALEFAEGHKQVVLRGAAHAVGARLAVKHGDHGKLITELQGVLDAQPLDEISAVRLGRVLVAEKRADDAHKLLVACKLSGMHSIAFEVALVEFWLYVNRNEDAIDELREAGKLYPESIDLLFLRAQVEDKSARFATARDLFGQVIQRDPKHLRALLRMAELLSKAGKHDEALATLNAGRKALGDDEALLRLTADELLELKRYQEARELAGRLLDMAPDNHDYLLRAAKLDLRLGQVDRGLGYLRKLRDMRMLDREAAYQMGLALATKGSAEEGAQTVLPFADQDPADVELNVLAGRLLLDSKDTDRAAPVLQRAVTAASGKSPEALFQFGRLALLRGDNGAGIQRVRQAITSDPLRWQYRLALAKALFDAKAPANARELALPELTAIVSGAATFEASGNPVTDLDVVYGMLARHYSGQHRYAKAVDYWRKVVEFKPDDIEGLSSLAEALHHAASPDASEVLRKVLKRRPNDARAAFFLALDEIKANRPAEALHWLEIASSSNSPETSEAWYHIALIKRERGDLTAALRAVDEYLKRAPKDATYYRDAQSLRAALRSGSN